MNLSIYIFYFFCLLSLAGGVYMLFSKSVIYSVFALLVTLLSIAALFVFAGAEFLGIAQIMIYIGGVLVLFLFGIMMTRRLNSDALENTGNKNLWAGLIASAGLFILLLVILLQVNFLSLDWIQKGSMQKSDTGVSAIGIKLMTNYILPFEIAALILLLALIGAAVIAAKVIKRQS
jgi:NADH-quinone oxidoreductase subunit J